MMVVHVQAVCARDTIFGFDASPLEQFCRSWAQVRGVKCSARTSVYAGAALSEVM
jgi:hypothetical protein